VDFKAFADLMHELKPFSAAAGRTF
jgi:hypothetical protein